jgi:hypothetical protein
MKLHPLIPIFILYCLFSCQSDEQKQGISIIKKSIEAHGGQQKWKDLQFLSLEKKTELYDENGILESQLQQKQEFRLKPYFEARMKWRKDSLDHTLTFDGLKTEYWMGENRIQNEGFLQTKKKELDAAFYVLNKPFTLLDEKLDVRYHGLVKLPNGQNVESVQVIDGNPEDPGVDVWWYYFHPSTKILLAYKVKTSDHNSLVYNIEMEEDSGILFPSKRESYRVDSLGNTLFLRAKYEYSNYKLN